MGLLLASWKEKAIFAEVQFNTSNLKTGIIGVSSNDEGKLKVMVEKGGSKYTYNYLYKGQVENFPLQMGNGEYKISVLQNISGNKYAFLDTTKVQLNLADPNIVYLNSVQNVRWGNNFTSIQEGKKLTASVPAKNRLSTLYNFMIKSIRYDYDKVPTLTPDYNPDIEQTFHDKKGICYDYSSLFAAMQRSQGIPVKLVKGYASGVDGYHAWNEVFVGNRWIVVDTTFDSAMWGGKANYKMVKNTENYKKVNEY